MLDIHIRWEAGRGAHPNAVGVTEERASLVSFFLLSFSSILAFRELIIEYPELRRNE